MKTILEILHLSAGYLEKKGIVHPRRQAEELVSQALGLKRLDLYLEFDKPLDENEVEKCRDWLLRRGKGEPVQYIQGNIEFLDCQIQVSPSVLIPRQETEILVSKVTQELERVSLEGKVLWDVCCGSGCIGIALKKRFPELEVSLSDISSEALAVARSNAQANEAEVAFLQGDLLRPFQGRKADFIVCNPPYIAEAELPSLDIEVRLYEPLHALIAGVSGMEFYVRLAQDLPPFLESGGKVWLEIGASQGTGMQKIFQAPYWKKSNVDKDWAGNDRFFSLEIE